MAEFLHDFLRVVKAGIGSRQSGVNRGLHQHFWQPFEVRYRLKRAGFRKVRTAKVRLAWEQFACAADLRRYPAPWDWFFEAEV